ncbi:MAG: type II/IV secretion system protein [Holosporales bacterium]|jgi:type II secretory ATPase GspE/PulE/Tfp pilus assembly ATPase PilB-like protein|nr:type II/IV secretion system protein [Holosporales bacterium]
MKSTDEQLKQELLKTEMLRQDQICIIEAEQLKGGESFDEICIRLGFAKSPQIKKLLASITGIQYVDMKKQNVSPRLLRLSHKYSQGNFRFVIFCASEARSTEAGLTVSVAMVDPADLHMREIVERNLREHFGTSAVFEFFYADKSAIDECFEETVPAEEVSEAEELNAANLFQSILKRAIALQASDIHFHAMPSLVQVRMRIDGLLRTVHELHYNIWPNLVIRIKILANIDIAESRRPQVGHFDMSFDESQKFDFRVSTHPTIYGESVVIRVLHKNKKIMSLNQLGFSDEMSAKLLGLIKRPYGLFLLCGPTGSGKTTTLYALCSHMDAQKLNIMTLEEPVEYQMEHVRQTEISQNGVISFVEGVRSILRQDPDVIFIGEIRDEETANIALRAAMTGHLVLSTLHSNDALRAPNRLFDLGVKPALLSGQIVAVMSQRLVRCTCARCAGDGCCECGGSGYRGRTAVCELMVVNEAIDECISSQKPIAQLAKYARASGYVPMLEDGLSKVRRGITTHRELQRAVGASAATVYTNPS